ncbi:MAG: class I SAM-dependent methyltransferase [Candidatus Edwardsbacteria bacterium]|nr:class I SAM-dependent methyltransferase [Candidatus Edwardsbacteria bacterium]
MTAVLSTPNSSVYRKAINQLKKLGFLLTLSKMLNPGRRIEIFSIVKNLAKSNNDILVDVGCGDGYWTCYFGKYSGKVIGIEPYGPDWEKANKNETENRSFICCPAEELPFKDNYCQTITSVCVFEHLYDDGKAFKEFYRVLKQGGMLLATVDSLDSPYVSAAFRKWHIANNYCNQLYSADEMMNKLSAAGFKNIEINHIMCSPIAVYWEKMIEKMGGFSLLLSPLFYPFILFAERKPGKTGYKIFVKAKK